MSSQKFWLCSWSYDVFQESDKERERESKFCRFFFFFLLFFFFGSPQKKIREISPPPSKIRGISPPPTLHINMIYFKRTSRDVITWLPELIISTRRCHQDWVFYSNTSSGRCSRRTGISLSHKILSVLTQSLVVIVETHRHTVVSYHDQLELIRYCNTDLNQ